MNDDYRDANRGQYVPLNANFRNAPAQAQNYGQQNYDGADANLLDVAQPPLSEEVMREIMLKKKADGLIAEIVYAVVLILTPGIFVMVKSKAACDIPATMWLAGVMGSYLADLILTMYQYHYLKVTQKESLILMASRYLVQVFLVAWLIYGNVLYFSKGSEKQCDSGLRLGIFLMLIIGYFEMMKCFCIGIFICILVPILFFAMRRAQRPNWMPAAPQFIQQLYKTKFNPDSNKAQEACPICMMDFVESDDIIPLPCDEKHYFHQDCIKQWLEKNNICPLCKKEITKEAITAQKKRVKNPNNKNNQPPPPPEE